MPRFEHGKARRDALSTDVVPSMRYTPQVIAPTVMGRPALDSMLGDMAVIAKFELEEMRRDSQTGGRLDEDGIQNFRHICELVIKQSRLEMAVEKHVEERVQGMQNEEIAETITETMSEALRGYPLDDVARETITNAVLKALGLSDG